MHICRCSAHSMSNAPPSHDGERTDSRPRRIGARDFRWTHCEGSQRSVKRREDYRRVEGIYGSGSLRSEAFAEPLLALAMRRSRKNSQLNCFQIKVEYKLLFLLLSKVPRQLNTRPLTCFSRSLPLRRSPKIPLPAIDMQPSQLGMRISRQEGPDHSCIVRDAAELEIDDGGGESREESGREKGRDEGAFVDGYGRGGIDGVECELVIPLGELVFIRKEEGAELYK